MGSSHVDCNGKSGGRQNKNRRKKSELLQFSAFGNSENLCGQINKQYNFAARTPTLCEGNCPPCTTSSGGPAILEDRSSLGILQPTAVIKSPISYAKQRIMRKSSRRY